MLYALISIIILVLVALYFGVGLAARSLADRRARSLLGNGRLAITFDDGPSPGLTNQILDLLREFEARATFFLIGETAEANPSVVQRIATEGHTVGWHSRAHLNQWKVNPVRAWRDSIRLPGILKAGPDERHRLSPALWKNEPAHGPGRETSEASDLDLDPPEW